MVKRHQSVLTINEISLSARIGCSADERSQTQPVRVKVTIAFDHEPAALKTDSLDDTVCYDKLTKAIVGVCADREFSLIEHMCRVIYDTVSENVAESTKVVIHVTKLEPPVNAITGGVTFVFGDVIS